MKPNTVRFKTSAPVRPTIRMRLERFKNVWRRSGPAYALGLRRHRLPAICNHEACQVCCAHEYDRGEGGHCLNCGHLEDDKPTPCPEGYER